MEVQTVPMARHLREWFPRYTFNLNLFDLPRFSNVSLVACKYDVPERELYATDAERLEWTDYNPRYQQLRRVIIRNATFWIQWNRDVAFGQEIIAFFGNELDAEQVKAMVDDVRHRFRDRHV